MCSSEGSTLMCQANFSNSWLGYLRPSNESAECVVSVLFLLKRANSTFMLKHKHIVIQPGTLAGFLSGF